MFQKVLHFVAWITLTPVSQDNLVQLSRYPTCSRTCVLTALESSGCTESNFACLCANQKLLAQISGCALPICSQQDFDQTYYILEGDCFAANESIKLEFCDFKPLGQEYLLERDVVVDLSLLDNRAVSAAVVVESSSSSSTSTTSTESPFTSSSSTSTTTSSTSRSSSSSSSSSSTTSSTSTSRTSKSSSTTTSSSTIDPPTSTSTTSTTSATPTTSTKTTSTKSTSLSILSLSTPTTATPDATFTPNATPFPLPAIVPCSDPQWQLSPENWQTLNVDLHLQQTRSQWGPGVGTFLSFVGNFTGMQGLYCGVGTGGTCLLPSCTQMQQAGVQPWQYLVAASIVEMNTLINVLHHGISGGKEDLALVIIAMANDFFEWKNPQTTTQNALPWIAAILTSVLSFVPVLFPVRSILAPIGGGLGQTAAAFAAGGLQTLAANASPDTFLLSNMESLGIFVKELSMNATVALETWSKALYAGEQDADGKLIIDYLANGRFAFIYDVQVSAVETFFFQTVVSDVVNDQLVSNTTNSKTFVMCADGNIPCTEPSYFSENGKSCCLYRFADNNTYIEPPEIKALHSSKYDNINSSSITASSLRTYVHQHLSTNLSDPTAFLNTSLTSLSSQPFLQGPSAAGTWTLPVCDVGKYTDWVADYEGLKMPCCCGLGCGETELFFRKAHLAGNKKINEICAKQYPGFVKVNLGENLRPRWTWLWSGLLGVLVISATW